MADPYETLGVDRSADFHTIKEAYRKLARRWHPDRFAEGPERIWAEAKMCAINSAYAECSAALPTPEPEPLARARALIAQNQPKSARDALMKTRCRSAEWNYLFGTALCMLGEGRKCVTYLRVAAHQAPENEEYRLAQRRAENRYRRLGAWRRLFARGEA